MADESLAVLPVVGSLVFIFWSLGLSYQEVNITLIGKQKQNYRLLRNFAVYRGVAVTVLISILALTLLADLWFINISGLSQELTDLSYLPPPENYDTFAGLYRPAELSEIIASHQPHNLSYIGSNGG
jgi:hypothetical protein